MYGYFKPRSASLSREEYRLFASYYCRICYCLRNVGGESARLLTTYDIAVYSIILNLKSDYRRPQRFRCERFLTRTMHKFDEDVIGKRLAHLSLILFGEKIYDDTIDGDYFRAFIMNFIYKTKINRVRKLETDMFRIARSAVDQINSLQNSEKDLYHIISSYGDFMVRLFSELTNLDLNQRDLIKAIANWTFWVDMLFDYDVDYKRNMYNGLKDSECTCVKDVIKKNSVQYKVTNKIISENLLEALKKANNGSTEWMIINKIVLHALSSTNNYLMSSRKEKTLIRIKQLCDICQQPK